MVSARAENGVVNPRAAGMRSAAGLARSLWMYYGKPWRQARLARFYAGLLPEGELAFDIGAHVGNRTRALRTAGLDVVAVEPQALFHRFLRATLPREGVTLCRRAVGASAGDVTLRISRRHPTVSSGAPGWPAQVAPDPGFAHVAWDAAERVPAVTLDGLIAAHGVPAFCKIDVEGMEAAVLSGLSQPLPMIAVEYLPAALAVAESCLDRLERLGRYEINAVRGEAGTFAWDTWKTPAAARSALRRMAADGRSGDLYARRMP